MMNRNTLFKRPDIVQTLLSSIATFTALALLGWVLAYWTWQWFSPQTPVPQQVAAGRAGKEETASRIFGKLQQESQPSGTAIRLLGVIAASGGSTGYAIMRYADQPARPVREGEEIAPGSRLSEVRQNKIVIDRNGALETIALPTK